MVGVTASALMGVMSPIIGKLSNLLETEYGKLKGVRRQIAFLRDELRSMNTALEMVSESEEASPHAKEWISQLRELSYDVEDCIEIFMHHLGHDDTCHRLIDKITSQLSTLKARHDIGDRINELKERALEINDRRRRYELNNPSATSSKTLEIDPRLPALFEEADRLVGIDDQRDKLVKCLADGIDLNLQRMVVAIVGFGGLGKTTLANQVFQKIKSQFDCTAFVSVSRRPDMNNILTDVLRQVLQVLERRDPISDDQKKNIERTREDLNMKTLGNHNLIRVIKEYLQNNRYFVVIDDIWSKEAWDIIQCAFPQNKNGSRMVATTRNQVVAKSCCFPHEDYVYHMKPLGSNDSKRLFLKRIFDCEDDCSLELKEVTDDILKKCDGLPLAIVNIASLLATKPNTKQEWERVRNSLCSALEQDHELEVIQRILFLSYYDLPHYLKICLLDLSLFPEDCEINRERLIWRWAAEGFIVEQRGQCLKDTGENYISELINRNMIQPVDVDYSGIPRACRVHDIMLDLLISLSAKENFVTILVDEKKLTRPANKIRRLSLQGKCEKQSISPGTNRLSHVRSLTVFSGVKKMPCLLDLQVLRVLDLQDCPNMEDGDIRYIGCLIHLRYLRLQNCSIGKIPREIGKLHRLHTLDLRGTDIRELPATVAQLRQLLRLFLPMGVELPNGIGNMESLEELSWFDVYKNSPSVVLELGNLTKLKLLNILWHPVGATSDEESCKKSLIKSLCTLGEHNIRSLRIFIRSGSVDFLADSWCPPPRYLQTFVMSAGICLSRLPRWISSLSELTYLNINIEQVEVGDLEVLKDLPALLSLELYINKSPQETLTIGGSAFQRLKEIKFEFMYLRNKIDGLSLMFEAGATPKLERLTFPFVARDTLSAYGVGFDFGICHLTSLKHLEVRINCRDVRAWEVEAAEANIRNAAALLPYHPTPEIYKYSEEEMVKDEVQKEDTDGAAEQPDGTSYQIEEGSWPTS